MSIGDAKIKKVIDANGNKRTNRIPQYGYKMTRKKIYNAIRWILLVPIVCIINVITPFLIANALSNRYLFNSGIHLLLATLLTGITVLISRKIAPRHKDTISKICAIIGFICAGFILYMVALGQAMSI